MKMQQNKWLKAIGILVLGLFLGWLIFGGSKEENETHEHQEVSENQVWTCSMHPQVRKNEPGDCPICGMELIPADSDESGDSGVYTMSENAMKLANVATMQVGKSQASKEVRLNGKVKVDERNTYSQSTHIPGRIEDLRVNFTGEKVNRGQTLAVVYSPELVTAQEELLQAEKIQESQPEIFEAAKEKLRRWKIGENQINSILDNGKPIERFPITADVSGIVSEKLVDLGDYVERGNPIYEISDLSKLWILFDLYESQLAWVQEGSKIEYSVKSLPGETFEGEISFIDPLLNAQTRVATARIEVDNANGRLKPEMFVSGTLQTNIEDTGSDEIIIPKSAVLWTGKRSLVYTKEDVENGAGFKIRRITLGPSLGDSYVVEEGLEAGDEIVVNGAFTVDAAVQLSGKPSMMNPPSKEGETNAVDLSEEAQAVLKPVLEEYLQLKDALVSDDPETAENEIKDLKEKLNEIQLSTFKNEHRGSVENYRNELEKNLDNLSNAEGLEEIRQGFIQLSAVMIRIAQNYKSLDERLYIQHCPMANNDEGADWLSFTEEIRNPYYGSEMLGCGEIIGKIN